MPDPVTIAEETAKTVGWAAQAAKEYGIFAVMVVFFIYWGYARENTLNTRIDAQDEFIRTTLVQSLDKNTRAFERFEAVLTRMDSTAK